MRSMAMMGLTQPNGTRARARVERCLGSEILLCLTLGYELACRTALAQHASVPDYHTSGAWVAVAGVAARLRRLDRTQTAHAMGIAERHGPHSQMMHYIDHLTMLKDGSG
jgi:2-methylcitrate dehydratase PrpD